MPWAVVTPRRSFAFLATRRWVSLTVVCVMVLPVFKALSDWQWRRLHQRQTFNAAVSRSLAAPPVPAAVLLSATPDAEAQWRQVAMCGTWDVTHQVLVRRKSLDTEVGFWVVTPLVDRGVTLVVVRGWLPAAGSSKDSPTIPTPPSGQVCTVSRLRLVTARTRPAPTDLPRGQVDQVEPGEISAAAYPGGYGELVSSTPDSSQGLVLWPAPELTEGPHRSYAIQWLVFAAMTVVGWVILVRGELRANSD